MRKRVLAPWRAHIITAMIRLLLSLFLLFLLKPSHISNFRAFAHFTQDMNRYPTVTKLLALRLLDQSPFGNDTFIAYTDLQALAGSVLDSKSLSESSGTRVLAPQLEQGLRF